MDPNQAAQSPQPIQENHETLKVSSSSDPHHSPKMLLIGLGAFLIIIIGGGIGYFMGVNNTEQAIPEDTNQIVKSSPTPTPDETANWKTYSTLAYSIKYPAEFTTTVSNSTSNVVDKTGAFNLAISIESTSLDLNSYVDQKSLCTSINSKNGVSYLIDSENSLRFEETLCGQTGSTHIYTIHNGTAYHFSIATQSNYDNYFTILNQILSTFKFLN